MSSHTILSDCEPTNGVRVAAKSLILDQSEISTFAFQTFQKKTRMIQHSIIHILPFAWTLISTLNAQSQGASACFTLDANSVCGKEFAGFPILSSKFANQTEFNQKMTDSFLNVDNVANDFNSLFGCPTDKIKPEITSFRFQLSYWCSSEVYEAANEGKCAINSTSAPKGPLLCQPQCLMAIETLQRVFKDETICPQSPSANANRTSLLSTMLTFCDTANNAKSSNGPNQFCSIGTLAEAQFCGKLSYKKLSLTINRMEYVSVGYRRMWQN